MGNHYALLVSVGNYSLIRSRNLVSWQRDLQMIQQALVDGLRFPKDHIRMTGENGTVTAHDLASAMSGFANLLGKEDTFLFYFSGHGGDEMLLFSDVGISLQSLVGYIDRLPAKNKIVVLDCCHSGVARHTGKPAFTVTDSLRDFVGHGTILFASSSADQASRVDLESGCSVFTGLYCAALEDRLLIHHGKKSLADIEVEVRRRFVEWNTQHPEQAQHPVIRSYMIGTAYFAIETVQKYRPLTIHYETDCYIVRSVKPLSTGSIKRLCAFVIAEREEGLTNLPEITKKIAHRILCERVYTSAVGEQRFGDAPARVVWCYFGQNESDLIRRNHYAYTIWCADEEVRRLYYKPNKYAVIKDDIYVFQNDSYDLVRKMQESNVPTQEYIRMTKELYCRIISRAEVFLSDLHETENRVLPVRLLTEGYRDWILDIYDQYYALSELPVPPDEIHDWAEEVLTMAGWILDIALALKSFRDSDRSEAWSWWLIKRSVRNYYDSLEKMKRMEES